MERPDVSLTLKVAATLLHSLHRLSFVNFAETRANIDYSRLFKTLAPPLISAAKQGPLINLLSVNIAKVPDQRLFPPSSCGWFPNCVKGSVCRELGNLLKSRERTRSPTNLVIFAVNW